MFTPFVGLPVKPLKKLTYCCWVWRTTCSFQPPEIEWSNVPCLDTTECQTVGDIGRWLYMVLQCYICNIYIYVRIYIYIHMYIQWYPIKHCPKQFFLPILVAKHPFFSGYAQFLFFSVGGPVVGRDRYAAGAQAPHWSHVVGELTLFLMKYLSIFVVKGS